MTQTQNKVHRPLAELIREHIATIPALAGEEIFAAAQGGVVTLYGHVQVRMQAVMATQAVLATEGVLAVADELLVSCVTMDTGIARRAADKLSGAPDTGAVKATVRRRILTVSGGVDWQYQREAACRAVSDICDVIETVNAITVHTDILIAALQTRLDVMLAHEFSVSRSAVTVTANACGVITVGGSVPGPAAHGRVCELVWDTPGVRGVEDNFAVGAQVA